MSYTAWKKPVLCLLAALFLPACQNQGPAAPDPNSPKVLADYIQAGGEGSGTGKFSMPYGLALDPSGDYFYVCDLGNDRIEKFSSDGIYVQKWGTPGNGPGQFYSPRAVAVDGSGNVYVGSGGRVSKFYPDGSLVTSWGPSGGYTAQAGCPKGLAFDTDGNINVLDTCGNNVIRLDPGGNTLGAWNIETNSNLTLSWPEAIAISPQNKVFISDYNLGILEFELSGTFIARLPQGYYDSPTAMAFDQNGNLYTAGRYTNAVLDPSLNILHLWEMGLTITLNVGIYGSRGIGVDAAGNIYVSLTDNDVVRKYKPVYTDY